MKRLVFLAFVSCTFSSLQAQKVENVRASASGEQIFITYDLSATRGDQRFRVNLYSSHNNFSSPVIQVTGDVGDNIAPGKDRRITWNARAELANYKGNLSFEVRADLITPAAVTPPANSNQFSFKAIPSVKRGGNLPIQWTGGTSSENVKLELVKENVPQQTLASTGNSGSYTWNVPSDAKPGTYQLKITGNSGSAVSSSFAIKHKVPTGLKVLPIVVIAGAAAAAGGGGGGGGGGGTPGGSNLPEPPIPTN